LSFNEVEVPETEELTEQNGIIGHSSLLKLLDKALGVLNHAMADHIFMVGGTCACEIVPVSYLNKLYGGDLAVLWFDAHGDLNTPETSPSHRLHGMPLRSLLGEGAPDILDRVRSKLLPSQVALVGARDLDPEEVTYIGAQNIPVFMPSMRKPEEDLIDFVASRGFKHVYIHFDLDVLEPSEFPHVLVPTEDGVRFDAAVRSLQTIRKNFEVVGCSVVEYCPKSDGGERQLRHLIADGLGIAL
jgi:arginase